MIEVPFSSHHRADLEQKVREGFDQIEATRIKLQHDWNYREFTPMSLAEFQVLVAADFYLRTTKDGAQ